MKGKVLLSVLLMLSVAFAGCTSDKDTDGDGIPDRTEERGAIAFVYGMEAVTQITITSDPEVKDTDGDGLSDFDEMLVRGLSGLNRLDPRNPDTDGDGLSDCQEWPSQSGGDCPLMGGRFQEYDYDAYQTDASRADGDQAGPSRYNNYHPNDGEGYLDLTDEGNRLPTFGAIKGDGISDHDEIFGYDVLVDGETLHVTSDPNVVDSDGDGLEDGEEALLFNSDPTVEDTDGDGCIDGSDPVPHAEETYGLDFRDFLFQGSDHFVGDARVVLMAVVANSFQVTPQEGVVDAPRGETTDLSSLSFSGVRPEGCSFASPINPWLPVQLIVQHRPVETTGTNQEAATEGRMIPIDVWSDTLEGNYPIFYWNVREDVYRWERPENTVSWNKEDDTEWFTGDAGFALTEGPEGTVELRSTVRF